GYSRARQSLWGESIRHTTLVGNCKANGTVTFQSLDELPRRLHLEKFPEEYQCMDFVFHRPW
ncbi:hypothetical protein, partial [Celeribacter sp.]|uniref:hypothetical protein n=1 Tax=Celeribacter sp. TaxID=1890673 RepID=UPI003A91ACFF